MNKERFQWTAAICVLALIARILFHYHQERNVLLNNVIVDSSEKPPTPSILPHSGNGFASKAQIEASIEKERAYETNVWSFAFATPIRFYGKVVDEMGKPIKAAKVQASFADNGGSRHTKSEQVTSTDGSFAVSGHGLGLVVTVAKQGYYELPESGGSFGYAEGAGTGTPHRNPIAPAIFKLKRMGECEPIFKFSRNFRITKDGAPVSVDLSKGRRVDNTNSGITVEAWTQDSDSRPFDWRCRITIPGGGFLKRKGEFDFIAPEDGYQTSEEINMPVGRGAEWRSQVTKSYLVKLGSGNYARVEFMMTAGGDHFFTLTSYFNPKLGSRNLEFDVAK